MTPKPDPFKMRKNVIVRFRKDQTDEKNRSTEQLMHITYDLQTMVSRNLVVAKVFFRS